MPSDDVPFYVKRNAKIDSFLTHFYVLRWDGQDVAIGEAGSVTGGPRQFKAYVAQWLFEPVTGKVNEGIFHGNMAWRDIDGPFCTLIPKDEFQGVKLANCRDWLQPLDELQAKHRGVSFVGRPANSLPLSFLLCTSRFTGVDVSQVLAEALARSSTSNDR